MLGGQKIIKTTNILDTVKYIDGLKAIIFDMDDTLYSEKEYIRSGYRKIAELFPQIEDNYGIFSWRESLRLMNS